jgi:intracellular septation protein
VALDRPDPVGFGALTVCCGDPFWIQVKPTAIYLLFAAALLFGGWLRGKAVLRYLLQSAFEGLDDAGWLKLSRNWGVFFVFLAGAQRSAAPDYAAQLRRMACRPSCGCSPPLSFIFTFAQMPMVLRHGLGCKRRGRCDHPSAARMSAMPFAEKR